MRNGALSGPKKLMLLTNLYYSIGSKYHMKTNQLKETVQVFTYGVIHNFEIFYVRHNFKLYV